MELLFPHDEIRDIQSDLIEEVTHALENQKNLIAHAPTGLGKTAAALAPALTYAIKNKKTVFFLTSRHTQHQIAIDTLKEIKNKHQKDFIVTDIIGKKNMCLQPGVDNLYTGEFFEYCKTLREDGKCEFYNNTYSNNQLSVDAKKLYNYLAIKGTNSTREVIKASGEENRPLCPYEMSQSLAKEARVIIADYYYIFNPKIQNSFFNKINKDLEDAIIIVDEAHNLPERIRELMTARLSLRIVDSACKEAKANGYNETLHMLNKIKEIIQNQGNELREEEQLLTKDALLEQINAIDDIEKITEDLHFIADEIREMKKRSFIGTVADFLDRWTGKDEGFVRYIRKEKDNIVISYRCLDPSLITTDAINNAHSVIMMSGTLTPTTMYRDLLGFKEVQTRQRELPSPFPEKNRLSLIIPETSTKYTARSEEQFKRIAEICADIGNKIKGNVAYFFPSYYLRDYVAKYFNNLYEKTIFSEVPGMSTEEKHNLIERFKGYKEMGSALLGVSAGSYGEGIDLPGDFLKGVVIVGLPLTKPDLEIKELIAYYDRKFGKGWDYGYTFPAFNKILQNAGRCIRSKTDKGVVVFLDERFAWNNYLRCFPETMKMQITKDYKPELVDFFW